MRLCSSDIERGLKRARTGSSTKELWFKEPLLTTNPSRIFMDEDDVIVDFLEFILREGYLRQ